MYKICIVGRPNVGKSSLFNKIIGRRWSITEPVAGTTRDKISAVVNKGGAVFELADTGGYELGRKDRITTLVRRQIELAVRNSDAVLFVGDVTSGVTPQDREILSLLRKSGKEIILAVNKVDNVKLEEGITEFYSFGIKDLYPVSAAHNTGIAGLTERLLKKARPEEAAKKAAAIKVAVIGRPNVGKSSFVNKAAGEEIAIVHEEPGTTRNAIDIHLEKGGSYFIFIDTAGMRHKRKIKEPVAAHSLLRLEASIKRSDVCAVVIDGYEGLTADDIRVISLVEKNGKGCVLLVNKWDLVSGIDMPMYEKALIKRMNSLRSIPIVFISARTGLNVCEVFGLIELVHKNMKADFSQEELAGALDIMQKARRLPLVRSGDMIQIRGIKQEAVSPPTFGIFTDKSSFLPNDYVGSIKNILREELGLIGAPIRIRIRRKMDIARRNTMTGKEL